MTGIACGAHPGDTEQVPDYPPAMYVREEAMRDVGGITEGLEACYAHAERIAAGAEFGDEPRAFLEACFDTVDALGPFKAWLELAEPAGEEWRAFLDAHPELDD